METSIHWAERKTRNILNLADDYFKTHQEAMMLRAQKDEMEKEIYSLKHELISLQMKQEAAQKED